MGAMAKLAAVGVTAVVLSAVLRKNTPELALLLALAAGLWMLAMAAEGGGPYSLSQPSADSYLKEGAFPLGGTKDYERGRTYIWKSI